MAPDIFKRKLAAAGMSRTRFARLAGVAPEVVDGWQSGSTPVPQSVVNLLNLLAGLDLPAETLFEIISGKGASSPGAQLRAYQTQFRQLAKSALATVTDLEAKLWGGHSRYAIAKLNEIVSSAIWPADGRTAAAYELARWQIHLGLFGDALKNLRFRAQLQPQKASRKEAVLLEFAALSSLGQLQDARALIERAIKRAPDDGDLRLASNNLHWAEDAGDHIGRLSILNGMYEANGLALLHLSRGQTLNIFNVQAFAPAYLDHPDVKISVLMAAFNAEEHIEMSALSVLNQSHHNIELVIVDDCSSDSTWEVLEKIAQSDDRVRIFRNDVNVGAYISRNRAFAESDGDIITVHDSDDWSHPQILERQLSVLLGEGDVRGTFSSMARADEQLRFKVRPHRRRSEYLHRSFPSLMMRRSDVEALGLWDDVRANADAEFARRAKLSFGEAAVVDVLPNVALSFFMIRPESLTEQEDTSLLSLTFGVRREYNAQADYYLQKAAALRDPDSVVSTTRRVSKKAPFPSPETLLPASMRTSREYDLALVSDLAMPDHDVADTVSYCQAALSNGMRVALFHWPNPERVMPADINPVFRSLNEGENLDIVTFEEEIFARLLVVVRAEILVYELDKLPKIRANRAGVLLDEVVPLNAGPEGLVKLAVAKERMRRAFGVDPEWLPMSSAVRKVLSGLVEESQISSDDWHPPLSVRERGFEPKKPSSRAPVLGRYAEDLQENWPADPNTLRAAYCADSVLTLRILGGDAIATAILGGRPKNWIREEPTGATEDFWNAVDFYLHYPNVGARQTLDRGVAEAMAAGVPVIAAPEYADVYGDAATYAEPADVYSVVQSIWFNAATYADAAARGLRAAELWSGSDAVYQRISSVTKVNPVKKARPKKSVVV